MRFYPDATLDEVNEFSWKIREGTVAMSALQGYLIRCKDDKKQAIASVDVWLSDQRSNKMLTY